MAPSGKFFRAATVRHLATSQTKVKVQSKAKHVLSTKRCLVIVNRLADSYLEGLPLKLQELAKRLKQGLTAKGKRHLEPEKATSILGKILRETNAGLQTFVDEASIMVAGAAAERESRNATAVAADAKLVEQRQAVLDCMKREKEAVQAIEDTRRELSAVKALRQTSEVEAKKVESMKRHLATVERDSYSPLKDGPADGPEGRKRLAGLQRAGKAFGFQEELLSIAPVILRKPLESRRTFDDLVVRQLASEFSKNTASLRTNIKDVERRIEDCIDQTQRTEAELATARANQKKRTQQRIAAEAAVILGQQELLEAKRHIRSLPADEKRAERNLAKAELRLAKFQRGPPALYAKALDIPLADVCLKVQVSAGSEENCSQ